MLPGRPRAEEFSSLVGEGGAALRRCICRLIFDPGFNH
jgi:hypothetical protein